MVTKTQYVNVKLTMRQLRYLDGLVRNSLQGRPWLALTKREHGVLSGVETKLSALVDQAGTDRSIESARVKSMMAEHNL